MADIPELVWYNNFKSYITDETEIWTLEYDVGWKGNLPKLYESLIKESNLNECSLIAYDCIQHNDKWPHHYKHTSNYIYSDKEPYACLIQMLRYHPKLLQLGINEINDNKYIYCESRAASICKRNNKWCKICDMYRPRNKFYGVFYSGTNFLDDAWYKILNNDSIPNSFWHRINTLMTH